MMEEKFGLTQHPLSATMAKTYALLLAAACAALAAAQEKPLPTPAMPTFGDGMCAESCTSGFAPFDPKTHCQNRGCGGCKGCAELQMQCMAIKCAAGQACKFGKCVALTGGPDPKPEPAGKCAFNPVRSSP